jgi:hypothetical protein
MGGIQSPPLKKGDFRGIFSGTIDAQIQPPSSTEFTVPAVEEIQRVMEHPD